MNLHNEAALLRYRRQRPQRRMDGGRGNVRLSRCHLLLGCLRRTQRRAACTHWATVITVRVDGREYRVREGRVITVRVDGREYRVREGRVREWANAVAERDAERRKAAEKKRGRV